MNKKRKYRTQQFICFLMILLMIVYYSQGVLYPQGSIISQSVLVSLFLLSIYFFFKVLFLWKIKKEAFVIIWAVFLVMNVLSFLFKGNFESVYIDTFKNGLLNLLPFFAFYYFTKEGVLKRIHLLIVFWLLLPIISLILNSSLEELREVKGNELNMVSNASYLFLGLIPFALLFKKRIFSYISLAIIFILLLQSLKRASIIGGILGFFLLFYLQFKTGENKGKYTVLYYIGSLIFIIVFSYFGYQYFLEHGNVMVRMEAMMSGDTSGRDDLASTALFHWYVTDNVLVYVFGLGFGTAIDVLGRSAHNDFVEILISYGIAGLFIYILLFYHGFKEVFNPNRSLGNKVPLLCLLLIGLLTSFTSRWYNSSFAYSQMFLLPYLIANFDSDKK